MSGQSSTLIRPAPLTLAVLARRIEDLTRVAEQSLAFAQIAEAQAQAARKEYDWAQQELFWAKDLFNEWEGRPV